MRSSMFTGNESKERSGKISYTQKLMGKRKKE